MNYEVVENEKKVYDKLDELGIEYKVLEHEPLYTAEDLKSIMEDAKGTHCKNLFLRNSKGNQYYMVVVEHDKPVDFKEIKDKIGSSRLSFASSDRLMKVLGLTPGAVNPFSLINDEEKQVQLYMDSELFDGSDLNFHPNVNYKMVTIGLDGILKFLESIDHSPEKIEI